MSEISVRRPRQAAVIFIFVTLVLDSMAGAIAYPVFPKLIGGMTHADAAHVAEVFGVFGTLFFVMQFFAAPVQGTLSDAFGRRPVILISAVGMAADYVIMALAPDLNWLYAGRGTHAHLRTGRRGGERGHGVRTGAGRIGRRVQFAPAVLDRGGIEPAERGLWLVRPAGIAEG